MPRIKKVKIRCPNKNCNTLIYREWNLGVLPKLLSNASLCFRCRKCNAVFYINTPIYLIEKFLDAMESDPNLMYADGEWVSKCEPITENEEKIFSQILQENQKELMDELSKIERINLKDYNNE